MVHVGGQSNATAVLPGTHCTGDWVGARVGIDGCAKNLAHTGIRSPDRVACSESL